MSPALDAFVQRRERAAAILDRLADTLQPLHAATHHADRLRRAARRAREGRFVVLLLGCFSTGKSTLLNALLGRPVLPVKVNPCTAILTEVVHGASPAVEIRHADGNEETLPIDTFWRRFQLETPSEQDAGAEAADRFGSIDRAILRWPLPLLRNGVVLLDTPGLDDDPARTARTLSSLPDADAVIFTLSANRFLTDLERKTLTQHLLPLGLTNLFFPITMVDLLERLADDPRAALTTITARARDVLGDLAAGRLFPLDARGALGARWDRERGEPRDPPDPVTLHTSGLAAFEEALERFLVEERGQAQLVQLYRTAGRVRDELARQARLDTATAETDIAELRARQEELEPQFERLAAIQRRLERTVDHFVRRTRTTVWQDLRAVMAEAEEALPDAVAELDLGGLAGLDLLTEHGRARIEARLREELERWLDRRLRTWQEGLAPRLERALQELREELATDAADFDATTRSILADFSGGSFVVPTPELGPRQMDPVERWFSVAVGALLLSPGTVAAAWTEGYEGALKGAAGRLGVRLAILGLGALLGPVGWAGLVLYVLGDALLLLTTGDTQLRRLRERVARAVEGKLVGQVDAAREAIEAKVEEGLEPLRRRLLEASANEVHEVRALLQQTIAARELAARDAADRRTKWQEALHAFDEGLAALRALAEPPLPAEPSSP